MKKRHLFMGLLFVPHPGPGSRRRRRLYEALVEEHEKGSEFSLKRADGEIVQYKIFV